MAEERVQMMINFYNIFFSLFLFLWGTDSSEKAPYPAAPPCVRAHASAKTRTYNMCNCCCYRYCCICAWVWDCLSVQLTHVAVVRSDPATPRHPRHPARLSGAIRESRERGGIREEYFLCENTYLYVQFPSLYLYDQFEKSFVITWRNVN